MEEPQVVKLQLEFETSTENELEGASFETHHLEIISTSPLIIESETLQVMEITDPENPDEMLQVIAPKMNSPENGEGPCEFKMSEVFMIDHTANCIYLLGTWVQYENCKTAFLPLKVEPLKYCFGKMDTYY
ncbi:MAG: hypothetical protein AB3N10_02995 [Allomuricauda sp.]